VNDSDGWESPDWEFIEPVEFTASGFTKWSWLTVILLTGIAVAVIAATWHVT